jgi:sulfhydrogenase subunit beta (sulfur reductase)
VKTNGDPLSAASVIERKNFDALFSSLQKRGYTIIGPTVQEGAIKYDVVTASAQLPIGWGDEQEAGKYRVVKQNNSACFGFNSTVQSWKRFLHPPTQVFLRSKKNGNTISVTGGDAKIEKLAFIGVRPCDLQAIHILTKVFTNSPYTDASYQKRLSNIFIVAVNCGQAGNTCFCASMKTGPKAHAGYDLALTEIVNGNNHYFVVDVGSKQGADLVDGLPHRAAKKEELERSDKIIAKTTEQMGRTVDVADLKSILQNNSEHKRWQETAKRCLTCANCTMVCPTCFCTTVEDVTDLAGSSAERLRKWDSCFTMDFSYIHGGSIRPSVYSRYRQWLTHKFASWQDQFGTFGCVGCGRCITWCPVGIDVTEEITAIRTNDVKRPSTILTKENE